MSLFCYITRSLPYRRHSFSFNLQLIWGNAVFVNVVSEVITLTFAEVGPDPDYRSRLRQDSAFFFRTWTRSQKL